MSLPQVHGGLNLLSAAAPGHVPGTFVVFVPVPSADFLLDFLVQISAPIVPFNTKQHLPLARPF